MPTLAVPSDAGDSKAWTQPPALTFTSSNSKFGSDTSSVYCTKSEPEHQSGCSAEPGDSGRSVPPSVPRGHRLGWTIPSRIGQPPSIPAFSQFSFSLSTLSSRSRASPLSLLSSSPSTPAALSSSGTRLDQQDSHTRSTTSSLFPRTPSPCLTDLASDWTNNNETSAKRYSTTSIPSAPRRSAFTTTAAFFTSMSRPSWDPFPLIASPSSHSNTNPNATTNATANPSNTASASIPIIPSSNPISIEDARLLDPSYLTSVPIPSQSGNYCGHISALGTGICIVNSNGGAAYSHTIPYIDPQGTLHDPDYRPFPLIRQTKRSSPSPFAIRKPYWEIDDDDELDSSDDDDDAEGSSTPNTPTSFIYYFLETHPLKRPGTPLRNNNIHNHNASCLKKNFGLDCGTDAGRAWGGKRSKGPGLHTTRSQLKLGTAYMYATIATGLSGSRSQGYAPSPTPPTRLTATTPQYTSTLSASPPSMEDLNPGKERKGWGGLLWKAGRKEGVD